MEKSSKKKIWKIIISVLVIGAIIFSTVLITQRAIRSKHAVESCENELENVISFLTNEDDGRLMMLYDDDGVYRLNIEFIAKSFPWKTPEEAEKFSLFLSGRDKEFIEKYNKFADNYPDLSDVFEDYRNKKIDILKAKELCFYRIYEALVESGLDYSYIYREGCQVGLVD